MSYFLKISQGDLTLVVNAESADVIATVMALKKEVDKTTNQSLKLTVVGAAEAHLLAHELGQAGIGVILVPSRSFPTMWQQKEMYVYLDNDLKRPNFLISVCLDLRSRRKA